MAKKPATKAEKAHMDAVRALGCIVQDKHCSDIMTIHHVRHFGSKRDHMKVLGICSRHHLATCGPIGIALEAGKETWRRLYGTEEELLEKTAALLAG